MGPENQTLVLRKRIQCSQLLSHLSSHQFGCFLRSIIMHTWSPETTYEEYILSLLPRCGSQDQTQLSGSKTGVLTCWAIWPVLCFVVWFCFVLFLFWKYHTKHGYVDFMTFCLQCQMQRNTKYWLSEHWFPSVRQQLKVKFQLGAFNYLPSN